MAQTISPPKLIAELREVASQIEASKSVDRDRLQFAKVLQVVASRFVEEDGKTRAWLAEVGATDNQVDAIHNALATWGEDLVPQASTTWNREELNAKVGLLKNMAALGMLEDEQVKELEALEPSLVARKKSGGGGERTPQAPIAGRPARIRLVDVATGDTVSTQTGNVTTSPGNIRQAACRFLEKKTGTKVTDAVKKDILASVNKVVRGTLLSTEAYGLRIEVA